MSKIKNIDFSSKRWQPSDHEITSSPFEEDRKKGNRKKLLLVSVYLVLLVGSLFIL